MLVRPEINLTLAEVQALATVIGLTGGPVLLSDDLPALPLQRRKIAGILIPLIDQWATVIDWFDRITPQYIHVDLEGTTWDWHLLTWFNWDDQPKDITLSPNDIHLPEGEYWASSFWGEQVQLMNDQVPYPSTRVEAHSVILLAVRRICYNSPQYLGSTLHLSQGLEVASWQERDDLRLKLELPRLCDGEFGCYLPGDIKKHGQIRKPFPGMRLEKGDIAFLKNSIKR